VTKTRAFQEGQLEVQDLGSQMILASAGVARGGCWLDACAGAGGKTLQLARLIGPAGRVDACDIRPAALAELRTRAARARLTQVRTPPAPDPAGYDGVLVDAPCSGSGTWRRAPHLKWVTTPEQVARAAAVQGELLRRFAPFVRPGGRLLYATCSLSRWENHEVVSAFLADQPDFAAEPPMADFGFPYSPPGLTIWPARHDTDGFFVAALRRR
jgi:16S rRNA (cytosine967-C5)-methyltransferase